MRKKIGQSSVLYGAFVGAIFGLIASCAEVEQGVNPKPNIVLIISDDQAWNDYSFMGHKHIETPRIDQLAQESLTFTHGYVTAPLCSPSLASIITGLYPRQHGVLGNDPVFSFEGKRYGNEWRVERSKLYRSTIDHFESLPTIADKLGEIGYVSLQTGKWWLGNHQTGGFDEGMTHGDPARGGRHGDAGLTIGREGLEVIYDFIDHSESNEKPFFVWYAPFLPHTPHTPPDSLREKYMKVTPSEPVANYWAMCEWFDHTCGQLIDYVDEKGWRENTLFIYITDNGWIQDPDRPNRYAPRSKRSPYEAGIRTPLMFRWPGTIPPEMNTKTPMSSVDIASTIYAIAGIDGPESLPGVHALDKAQREEREAVFAAAYAHDFTTVDSSLYYSVAIDWPYKLIVPDPKNQPTETTQLFNLAVDPHEQKALADEELINQLSEQIANWRKVK
ncbi:MAG: sulfatase-like hydrolase/transferase [Bacteroidota bacterium]